MKAKLRIKYIIDLSMAAALPFLMAQALVGEKNHEWLGVIMFALAVVHTILNINWYRNLFKGRYGPFRVFQLVIDLSVALSMIGLMVSGIMMSRHVFSFLSIESGMTFARTLHMISAYWGLALMSVHAGLHTHRMMAGIANPSKALLRGAAALLCAYGIYAFVKRQIGSYMLLRTMFVFFDFREPLAFFIADYTAIMGLFVCAGHYISAALRKIPTKKKIH